MVTNTSTKSNITNPFAAFAEITNNSTKFYEADNNKGKERAVIPSLQDDTSQKALPPAKKSTVKQMTEKTSPPSPSPVTPTKPKTRIDRNLTQEQVAPSIFLNFVKCKAHHAALFEGGFEDRIWPQTTKASVKKEPSMESI
eukprot:13888076-Ditylum_brightwellii.AAC.1